VARPKEGYRIGATKIPSVTTVITRFKDPAALLYWSNTQGLEGKTLQEARESAMSAGTLAHQIIEARLTKQPEPDLEAIDSAIVEPAFQGVAAYDRWADAHQLEVLVTEEPMVSEKHAFGGTPDVIGKVSGRIAIVDWKTSKGGSAYVDHLIQLCAYAILVEECIGLVPVEGHVLILGREDASFHHHSWILESLADARESFLLMRRLYDLDRVLKRKV